MDIERVKLGFELIRDLSIQLITLATGMLAVTVAAAERGMLARLTRPQRWLVRAGWGLCLTSTAAGLLQLMALTGVLLPMEAPQPLVGVPETARIAGQVQLICFMAALALLVGFVARGVEQRVPVAETGPKIPIGRIVSAEGSQTPARGRRGKHRRRG